MIKTLAKFVLAIGIIYWLLQKGELDFSLIPKSLKYYWSWIIILLLLVTNILITSWRWKILVEIKSEKKLPIIPVVKLTWIGAFFSSVLPGIVTGDIVKLFYARELDKNLSKTYLLTKIKPKLETLCQRC